jgi:hypothetical protein
MNDETMIEDVDSLPQVDELTMLKQRARMMGIEFSNNIGIEKLRERIQAKMDGETPAPEPTPEQPNALQTPTSSGSTGSSEKPISLRQYLQREKMKLVRLRITNLDPKKKDLPGEIFTVANEYLGTVRKYVPYGEVTDDGYHVPYCIYKELESRRFLNIRTRQARNGQQVQVESAWAKEFALEVLPPLTKEELRKLAAAQAAAGGVSS